MIKFINLNYNGKIPKKYTKVACKMKYFNCGEFEFSIEEDISGQEIFIFQSFTVGRFNDDLMAFQVVCDVLKRNNVGKIVYFSPFLPYTRQDKSHNTKYSLASKVVAGIVNRCGIDEVITYDIHNSEIQNFFECKVQNLSLIPSFIKHINANFSKEDVIIIFPDYGSTLRFKEFFIKDFQITVLNKIREKDVVKIEIFDDVKNKIAIIIDDMIDSGSTLIEAVKILKQKAVKNISVYATHGIFSGNSIEELKKSQITNIVVSNSLRHEDRFNFINTISIEM